MALASAKPASRWAGPASRADSGDYLVEPLSALEAGPAHLLAGFAEANAMIHLPEDAVHVRPGDIVDVEFLRQRS